MFCLREMLSHCKLALKAVFEAMMTSVAALTAIMVSENTAATFWIAEAVIHGASVAYGLDDVIRV